MAENTSDNSFKEWQSHRPKVVNGSARLKLIGKPAIKKAIVPIIYIPGIFGSRLEKPGDKKSYVWDPDRSIALTSNYAGLSSPFTSSEWSDEEIDSKVTQLHGTAEVMSGHDDNAKKEAVKQIKASATFLRLKINHERGGAVCGGGCHMPDEKQLAQEEYERRSKRGWYGVWNSYHPLLETLNALTDPEFHYPVFAFGYDWRFDLDQAAEKLVTKINEVLAVQNYPDYGVQGKDYDKIHPKVIIVTHSQGGLVARYAMMKLSAEGKVQAVVHLNQPTTGAPVLYQRFITGTSPERSFFTPKDNVFSAVLGSTPYHFTRMAAQLTGALSLLPTNDYVENFGDAKYQWLRSSNPHLKFDKPIKDIYDDVYLSEKWGLINCKRYDAAGQPWPYKESDFDVLKYFSGGPNDPVEYHMDKRHTLPGGQPPADARIAVSGAKGVITEPAPADNPYRRDNQRLRPHAGMDRAARVEARVYWDKFTEKIKIAQSFHANLGLLQHKNTRVIRARGVQTVTQVTMRLNAKRVLECPLIRSEEGDGTVPLSSQEILLADGAKSAGAVIQGGKHAEICTDPAAMRQVMALLTGTFVTALRTQP